MDDVDLERFGQILRDYAAKIHCAHCGLEIDEQRAQDCVTVAWRTDLFHCCGWECAMKAARREWGRHKVRPEKREKTK